MIIKIKLSALRQSHWYEYLLRFALGGAATAVAGAIASFYGPAIGGLFLAFPAILCASATLVEKHERKRKERLGLTGRRRGTDAAALDAAGAALGGLGLVAFAMVVEELVGRLGAGVLVLASATWLLVSIIAWRVRRPRLLER
jgi:hypothetical protein